MPYLPQEFLDELNALTPDAGIVTALHVSLGSDFDEFFGPEALMRHFDDQRTQEEKDDEARRYAAKLREHWPAIKEQMIKSHMEGADRRRQRIAEWKALDFNDSYGRVDQPPISGVEKCNL